MRDRILIVDDHGDFRTAARMVLEADGYLVVGEAADAASTVEAIQRTRPDIVLVDIQLPDGDGISLSREIADLPDPPAVVLISSREKADYGARLAGAAAMGFVSKAELSAGSLIALLDGA